MDRGQGTAPKARERMIPMTRACAILGVTLLAGLLGGCGGGGGVLASISNVSTATIEATVQPVDQEPGESTILQIPPGGERAATFERQQASGGLVVEVRLADPASGSAQPQLFTLTPPGPYLVQVSGNQRSLAATRRQPQRTGEPDIPRDPRQEGFTGDIPPVDPPTGGGPP